MDNKGLIISQNFHDCANRVELHRILEQGECDERVFDELIYFFKEKMKDEHLARIKVLEDEISEVESDLSETQQQLNNSYFETECAFSDEIQHLKGKIKGLENALDKEQSRRTLITL